MKSIVLIIALFLESASVGQNLIIQKPVRFLALGDSYTIGHNVLKQESWPAQFSLYLKLHGIDVDTTKIIAQTGWTTSNLLYALQNSDVEGKFNLVSLLIGVNNQYQGMNIDIYKSEFETLIKKAIEISGSADGVFVLSIPDYGYTPFGYWNQEKITKEIDEYNAINKSISDKYSISYFDITVISRLGLQNPNLLSSDGLHPSGKMYGMWVDLIAAALGFQGGTTSLEKIVKEKDLFYLYVNQSDKSVKFELLTEEKQHSALIELFSINGSRVASFETMGRASIQLKSPGIYIYYVKINKTSFYTGKIILL